MVNDENNKCNCGGYFVWTYRDEDFDWYACTKCHDRIGKCRQDKEDFSS
jgi:hypothetical protein